MSYSISLYFRDPQTKKFANPYDDEVSIIYTPEEKQQIKDRDAGLSELILEQYPAYFERLSDENGVFLRVKEEYWKWSFSFEYYDTSFVIDIRYHEIPADEERQRNTLIEHIIWIISQKFECIIDDPQIGTIYIPERLIGEIGEQFEEIETLPYTQEKDIRISEESFDRVFRAWGQPSIAEKIAIYDREWTKDINNAIKEGFLTHTPEGIGALNLIIDDMHKTYAESTSSEQDHLREGLKSNIRLAGSFFGSALVSYIPGATWKYDDCEMEGSVVNIGDQDRVILEIAPFSMVESGIIHGDFGEQITELQKQLNKAQEKCIPFWKRRSTRLILSIVFFVLWLAVAVWKTTNEAHEFAQKNTTKTDLHQTTPTAYTPVTISVDPVTYEISRPKDMQGYASLTWVIQDGPTQEHRLKRNAAHETSYTYFRNLPGSSYRVFLEAFDGKKYVTVSNIIEYRVPPSVAIP